jgi:hypothetical protein
MRREKTVTKIDLKKKMKDFYNPSSEKISLVDVPPMNFMMIDGKGDPNKSQSYQDAIEALYAVSYGLKFMVKKERSVDYAVMPLEGLWWTDDMTQFSAADKGIWQWTAMIMQPEYVTDDLYRKAVQEAAKKKSLPALREARFHSFHEGLSVQILFIGPFSAEGPVIEKLHTFIRENGYAADGVTRKHHEIYLSDVRRTEPDKLKTVLRQPVTKASKT